MEFERLLPPGPPIAVDEMLAALRPWERAPADRPLVLVNMVATADGLIAIDGESGPIGGGGDFAMFHGLRTIVDAVLVGSGTLRAERYGRLVRRPERRARRAALGLAEDPVAILVSRSGDLPFDAPMFAAPEQRIVIAGAAVAVPAVAARVENVVCDPAPAAVLRAVRAHVPDLRCVLCEGGPTLNRALLADGVLDELFLTVAPKLGGGGDGLRVLAGDPLPEPYGMRLLSVAHHEGELFLRYAL